MKVHFQRISANDKTGPIPVSNTSMDTCPDSCQMKPWCYARLGPLSILFRSISGEGNCGPKRYKEISWDEFCGKIHRLPKGQIWRHNSAGDLPGTGDTIDHSKLAMLVEANRGRQGFTYTHKPVGLEGQSLVNACAIRAANLSGLTISLSADNLEQADALAALGIAPVVAVVPMDAPRHLQTPGGLRGIVCPHEMNKEVQCVRCKLCTRPFRKVIVCFRAHGSRKHKLTRHLKVIQGQAA